MRGAPAPVGDVDPEQVALEAGLKPALRLALDEGAVSARGEALVAAGYVVVRGVRRIPQGEVLYVGRDAASAAALREAEAPILPGGPSRAPVAADLDAHRRLGKLLGYPSCCVEAFVARVARDVTVAPDGGRAHEDFVAALDILSRTVRADALLNPFPLDRGQPLVPFYPCRLDCLGALGYAHALLDAVRARSVEAAGTLESRLRRAVSILRDGTRVAPAEAPAGAAVLRFD